MINIKKIYRQKYYFYRKIFYFKEIRHTFVVFFSKKLKIICNLFKKRCKIYYNRLGNLDY